MRKCASILSVLSVVALTEPVWADVCLTRDIRSLHFDIEHDWEQCVSNAVDHFYDQPEPAETIVAAAFATCREYELKYAEAVSKNTGECEIRLSGSASDFASSTKRVHLEPKALARVMAARAALKHAPRPKKPTAKVAPYDRDNMLDRQ